MLRRLMHWMLRRLMRRLLRCALMHRMVHGLAGLHRGRRGRASLNRRSSTSISLGHGLELGLEVLEPRIMLVLELLDELVRIEPRGR